MNTTIVIAFTALISLIAFVSYETVIMAWLPALLVGGFILINSLRNDQNKFVGILVLKPLLIFTFWAGIGLHLKLDGMYVYLTFIPDLVLTLVIAHFFRNLLKDELLFVFFVGDIVRWASLLIELLIPDPYPEPFISLQVYVFIFFFLLFPSLYAVYGFMEVRNSKR